MGFGGRSVAVFGKCLSASEKWPSARAPGTGNSLPIAAVEDTPAVALLGVKVTEDWGRA